MREHVFHADPWLAPDHSGERLCLCGLFEKSRWHVPPPETPEGDVSARILGEGETVDT